MENSCNYNAFPVFLILNNRRCVIAGGGKVAERKITDLLEAGADIIVVARDFTDKIEELAQRGLLTISRKDFDVNDLEGAFLVFAATDNEDVNLLVYHESRKRNILVNVVDNPELCDFFSGSVLSRGPLKIAVSTSGRSPAVASSVRNHLESLFPESYGKFVETAGEIRKHVLSLDGISKDKKKKALAMLGEAETFSTFLESGKKGLWKKIENIISS